MTRPGIGHNSAASGQSWRRYAWRKARKDLVAARVPLEIVRLRIKRAERLGLTYPQYASILLGSGRDIVGFLFTVGGLQLRLARQLEAPDHVAAKLRTAPDVMRIALAPPPEEAEAFRIELEAATDAAFNAAATAPCATDSWRETRRKLSDALAAARLPADGVVMIGDGSGDAKGAEAAFLAKYIPTQDYFPLTPSM